jgi:hypothetical protein
MRVCGAEAWEHPCERGVRRDAVGAGEAAGGDRIQNTALAGLLRSHPLEILAVLECLPPPLFLSPSLPLSLSPSLCEGMGVGNRVQGKG